MPSDDLCPCVLIVVTLCSLGQEDPEGEEACSPFWRVGGDDQAPAGQADEEGHGTSQHRFLSLGDVYLKTQRCPAPIPQGTQDSLYWDMGSKPTQDQKRRAHVRRKAKSPTLRGTRR